MPQPASGDPMPEPRAELDPGVIEIAAAIRGAGGRAIVVGGWVRDRLRGTRSKDVDIEVFGLEVERLEAVLAQFGDVLAIGRAFGVFRVAGLDVDFSLPRRDSKRGPGHRGFDVVPDPSLEFDAAARRRDLTVNSIGLDPLTGEVLDPHGGCEDLARRTLRATDPQHFPEDPLRGLRVVQLAARLEMEPDEALVALCRELDLSELSGERVFEEFRKLLLRAARPSLGFTVLEATGQLRFFPELDALRGVEQDPEWHPEGDVWVHTLMVVDAAASLRVGNESGDDDLALMLAALCHDLGKPVHHGADRRTGPLVSARCRGHRPDPRPAGPDASVVRARRQGRSPGRAPPGARPVHPERRPREGLPAPRPQACPRRDQHGAARARRARRPPRAHDGGCGRRPFRGRRRVPCRGARARHRPRGTPRRGARPAPD